MKSVAMIGIKDSYKVWAVEFDSGSAILDWQDANPDFEVHSWAPVVALEAALGYAKGGRGRGDSSQPKQSDRTGRKSLRGHRRQRTCGNFNRTDQNFHRPRLCAAIVDRLTFGGNIVETGTDSLAHTRKQQQPT